MPVEAPQPDPPEINPDVETVRLLITDVDPDTSRRVLSDQQLQQLLDLEHGSIKLAAAQAMDTIASSEVLAAKVIRTAAGTTTDGAKVADALRKHAAALRAQVAEQTDADDDGFFEVVDVVGTRSTPPELTGWVW